MLVYKSHTSRITSPIILRLIMNQLTLILVTLSINNVFAAVVESCDSQVYCQGELLKAVQLTYKLFEDSKTFVDLIQVNDPSTTLENFDNLMTSNNNNPSHEQMEQYVKENFVTEGELDNWTPPDYTENPQFLEKITNAQARNFAKKLVQIWPTLGRKVKTEVSKHSDRHSLIYLPEGFIIPGGRFKEVYYWDSYWIIKGLLISEMKDTVRGMLDNFLSLVQRFGFIPNGSRVYYLNRSQPPFLSLMVGRYIDATDDLEWLKNNIKYIEAELNWWISNRTIEVEKNGTQHTLARYAVISGTPRPESYFEDIHTCGQFRSRTKESCYKNLKSGAESGWDFSTRWWENDTDQNLSHIDTYRVIPVDLNSILCKAFKELARFHVLLGNTEDAGKWWEKGNAWQKSIEAVLYDRNDGIWYDYDISVGDSRRRFYPSNFAPLWTECYNTQSKNQIGGKAAQYFNSHVDKNFYLGGIPTSIADSGEQWDYPNAWPPLQEMVVTGLYKTDNDQAVDIALTYAKRWVESNLLGYQKDEAMYEKYDAVTPGQYGGGGEYDVQAGFGWTNGVALQFLNDYPDIYTGSSSSSSKFSKPPIIVVCFYNAVVILYVFVGPFKYKFFS